ncbi:MAG: response regulator [Magnetococcales bacterium]|nr:response regulator [Magnetococcales bacterium]
MMEGVDKQRILIVDDLPGNIRALAEILGGIYDLSAATSGLLALQTVAKKRPDMILLDIIMPDMDGFEVCARLKTDAQSKDIPIIFITVKNTPEDESRGLALGAVDFVSRPINPVVLLARIKTHLEIKRQKEDLETLRDRLEQRVEERTAELREQENFLRSVLNNALDSIIIVDEQGRVTDFNPAAEKLFGYDRQEILGRSFVACISPPELQEQHRTVLAHRANTAETCSMLRRRIKTVGMRADGQRIQLDMALISFLSQGKCHYAAFIHDITDFKQLLKSLEETLTVAESASRTKSNFIANMSHEIRTPMNAIIGLTHLAIQSDPPAHLRDYLQTIKTASHSLMSLINDILDFSKMDANRMQLNLAPFYLVDLFDRLGDLFSEQTADKGLELLFILPEGQDRCLLGDVQRLEQVLLNLIRNAVKFTDSGSIVVSVHATESRSEQVELTFSVRDTGIGIEPDTIGRLFAPFVQADGSSTRQYGGTGLGLAICKQLVTLMGGEIWAESIPEQGSTFHFVVTCPFQQEEKARLEIPVHLQGMPILVVDDHALAQENLVAMLRDVGFAVTGVDSGAAALTAWKAAQAAKTPYALLMVDWHMPGMDGIETVRQICHAFVSAGYDETTSTARLPRMILLAAFGRESLRQQAMAAGVSLFLHKPVSRAKLWQAILAVFGATTPEQHTMAGLTEEQETRAKIGGARILLVDDNDINQQVALDILQRVGLVVKVANNGLEALHLLDETPFDAVLMDLQMPKMNGFAATRRIRSDPRWQHLPIIAMTAHVLDEERAQCLAAGMNAHLGKPIQPEKLYAALVQWIKPGARSAGDGLLPSATEQGMTTVVEEGYAFSDLPGVDWATGLQRLGGNRRLYQQLLWQFRQQNGQVAEAINQALAAGDWERGANLVHKIKGSAGNLGASRLYQTSLALEHALREGNVSPHVPPCTTDFMTTLHALLQALSVLGPGLAAAQETRSGAGDAVDLAQVEPLLAKLVALLRLQSLDTDAVMDALGMLLGSSCAAILFQKLAEKIEEYDFDAALHCVTQITERLALSP